MNFKDYNKEKDSSILEKLGITFILAYLSFLAVITVVQLLGLEF
jgi:hypothetical protein